MPSKTSRGLDTDINLRDLLTLCFLLFYHNPAQKIACVGPVVDFLCGIGGNQLLACDQRAAWTFIDREATKGKLDAKMLRKPEYF
jgi:hypothetical protein